MRRIISMLLQNEVGALARIANLISARGYNIDSLTVAATHDPSMSRLTMVTHGEDVVIDQIIKQTRKLVDVIEIADLTSRDHLECELLMVKVAVAPGKTQQLAACVRRHPRAMFFDEGDSTRTIQITGSAAELNAFLLEVGATARIVEMARSGTAALDCGERILSDVA